MECFVRYAAPFQRMSWLQTSTHLAVSAASRTASRERGRFERGKGLDTGVEGADLRGCWGCEAGRVGFCV
jgi:hypothetical protein